MFHLNVNPESADVGRAAHGRPRRRFLGHGDRARQPAVRHRVEPLQEVHGFEVLAPAVLVGNPLAVLPRVVEIEHRRHGIDAQAVDVELLQPVERAAQEKRSHLRAAVVEDQRAPVLVLALTRVVVLVERRPVESARARAGPSESDPAPSRESRPSRGDGTRR